MQHCFVLNFSKYYNTELRELILGAQAIKRANLPKIMTKHISNYIFSLTVLVMASEDLYCMLNMIPWIRKMVESQLDTKQQAFLANFDTLIKDCVDHQNKLYEKIIEIMNDTLEAAMEEGWMVHTWDMDVKAPSDALVAMVKNVHTIMRLLTQFLKTHKPILIVSVYWFFIVFF